MAHRPDAGAAFREDDAVSAHRKTTARTGTGGDRATAGAPCNPIATIGVQLGHAARCTIVIGQMFASTSTSATNPAGSRRLFACFLVLLSTGCASGAPQPSRSPSRVAEVTVPAPVAPSLPDAPPRETSAVPSTAWRVRLETLYASLGNTERRRDAYTKLLAPRLSRFIGLRQVPRAEVIAAADAFFANKTNIGYSLHGEVVETPLSAGVRVAARVSAHYESPVPATWKERVPELEDQTVSTHTELAVELEADADGAVISYLERAAPIPASRLRVKTTIRGYELPYVPGCWKPADDLASVELAMGTIVDVTAESIIVAGCGPPTSVVRIRDAGRKWWVLMALYERVPNPAGGTSLGGTDYLEYAPP